VTQASASALTPRVSGSPKKIMIASPTYLSIVAPCSSATRDISVRYWLSSWVTSSDSIWSVVAVNPAMSEKNTVSFLRWLASLTSCRPAKIEA
jgi:hypothetical protein